jgi:hypothetical protein
MQVMKPRKAAAGPQATATANGSHGFSRMLTDRFRVRDQLRLAVHKGFGNFNAHGGYLTRGSIRDHP